MSTSNFHNVNASKVYAVQIEDEFEMDDLVINLQSVLEAGIENDPHELRSYPSRVVGHLSSYRRLNETEYSADDITLHVYAVIRSGYYSGVNLDWFYSIEWNGEEYNQYNEFASDIRNNEDMSINEKSNIMTWVMLEGGKLQQKMEKIFEDYGTPLRVVGTFSNGETVYEVSK